MNQKVRRMAVTLFVLAMLVSLFPIPASSATGAVLGANIISQGTAVIKGTWHFNCENGTLSSNGDIWWEQETSTIRRMAPVSPAKIVNLGVINFDAVKADTLDNYTYTSNPIVGNNDSTNKLVNGDVFAVYTKLGHYTKIQVISYGYNLSIRWVTYTAPLATPALVSPLNNQIFYHYPRTTTLSWRPVAGATSYVIERQYYSSYWVSYSPVIVNGVYNTSYTFNFVGDQPGRWRITAYSTTSLSSPSPWWTFTYSTAPTAITPVLVSPANGASLYNYPRTTTLTWKPSPGASGYLVEVQYYDSAWHSYKSVTLSGALAASYTFTFVGKQPGRWRVTAIGASPFRNSSPSAWRTFTYKI